MRKIFRVVDLISTVVGWIGIAVTIAMGLYMAANVLSRWIIGVTVSGGFEIVQFMLCLTIFSAFCFTNTKRRHVSLCLLIIKLPVRIRFSLSAVIFAAEAAMVGCIAYGMFTQAQFAQQTNQASTTLGIPFYPFYFICGLFSVVLAVTLVTDVIKSILAVAGSEEYQKDISAGWV